VRRERAKRTTMGQSKYDSMIDSIILYS